MIPSWARVGAKVVCVDGSPALEMSVYIPFLEKGEIYLVEGVLREKGVDRKTGLFGEVDTLKLAGVARRGTVQGFDTSRFRPLITEADDIAQFKSLLNPTLVDKLDLLAERMNELAED